MATLMVEGIPPGLLCRLAGIAVANGRGLDSEVILSLERYLQDVSSRNESAMHCAIFCPFGTWSRSEVPAGFNVSWGDPG